MNSADTDVQFLWINYGWAGVMLLAVLWITANLMQIWVAFKTNSHLDDLKRATERDSIRFSRLHDKRALIIKDLYDKLLKCSDSGMMYVTESSDEAKKAFFRNMIDFGDYYKANKIYFSDAVCDKIQDVHKLFFDAVGAKFAYPHREKEMSHSDKLVRDLNVLTAVSPEILAELEREFRQLLGVEVDPKRKVKQPTFISAKETREAASKIT